MQLSIDTSPLQNARARWVLSNVDAFDWLEQLPAECVDLVVTDPPYASLERHRAVGTTTRLQEWFEVIPDSSWPRLMAELWRVLRMDSHCYVMVDAATLPLCINTAKAAGFTYWKPLVWDKVTRGMGYHYAAQTEFVVFLEKGKRPLNSREFADVFRLSRLRGPGRYPTEKPAELVAPLITNSSTSGEIVADPFFGSGVVAVSALQLGRRFIGTDTAPAAHEYAIAALHAAGFEPER